MSTSAAGARDVEVADLDGDGDADIVAASYTENQFSWYESDGAASPSFVERAITLDAGGPRAVAVADMDGDLDLDVVGAAYTSDSVGFFENTDGSMGIQVTAEDTPLTFNAANNNLISIGDVDAGASEMKVRLEITNGTLSLSGIAGLILDVGTGTDDAIVEFRGSLTDINNALNGMVFTPTQDYVGIASVRIITDDQGNSGSGGPLTDDDTINITVTPVNDAPIAKPDGVHLSFDGDDFVEIADHASLQMTNKVTMEAWINPAGTGTGSQLILNKEGEYELGIIADTGEILFAVAQSDNTWAWHYTGQFVTLGEWSHVAVAYDGVAGEAKTYINGELVDTFSQSGAIGDVYPAFNDLMIGGRGNDTAERFEGQIDEVRVWSTTRTLGDIQSSKDGQLTGAEIGLVGNWRLDEAAGGAVIDQSAFGNDGVLGGSEGAAATPSYQGYITDQNTVLNIAAIAGVLVNDSDIDLDTLSVTNLDTTGMLGMLTLNTTDGSFDYDPNGAFDYLDVGEQATETFTYTANDGSVDSNTVTATITITGVNDTPTTSGIANVTVTEDDPNTVVDLYAAFADVEDLDPALTYRITNNTNAGLFTSTNIAGGNPDPGLCAGCQRHGRYHGQGNGYRWPVGVESTFTVTVNPQNDTPTTTGLADVTVTEDDPNTVVDLYAAFADVEDLDPALTYTITNNTNAGLFTSTNIAGGNLTLDYAPDANGTADITVRATDTGGLWVESTFTVTVNPQNDTPTTTGLADVTVTEDDPNTVVDLYAAFADVEDLDPALTYTITNNTNAGLFTSTNIAGGNLTLDYAPDANGTADITVRATDTGGLWVESTFTVTVNPANDTPTTSGIANVTVTEDDPNTVVDLYAAFADVEDLDPALTYTITNNTNAGLFTSTNIAGGNLTLDYAPDANGSADITVRATDTGGLWVESTFTVTVNPAPDAPVIGGVNTGAVTEDVDPDLDTLLEAAGALTIADPDAGESNFVAGSIAGSHGNLIIDASGNWDYEADNTQASIQQLDAGESVDDVLTVTTADGTNHNVTVTINGSEDAPVIGGVMAGAVVEDGILVANGTLSITDVDTSDNPVSFPDEASVPGDNGYGDFQLAGGSWSYTLNNGHAAVQALGAGGSLADTHTFTASDGSTQLVSITIAGAAEAVPPPAVEPPPPPGPTPEPPPIEPPPAPEGRIEPPVEEEPDPEEPPPAGRTDPTAGEPETGEPSGYGQNPAVLEPLEPSEILLSVINDARPNDASGIQKSTTAAAKPDVEAAQTFLQELKSFWQDDSTSASVEMSEARFSQEFWNGLDKMANDLDESVEEQERKMQLSAEAAAGVGISLTAGFVSWALRAGSMAASFLAAMPTWRHFDPMPVLAEDKGRKDKAVRDAEDDESPDGADKDTSVDDLFER